MRGICRLALCFAAVALPAGGCGGAPDRATVAFDSGAAFEVEIADTETERRRGLMGRAELPERGGMLFVHAEDVQRGFWMKDTLIPLSIAFLDRTGRVVRILDMEPCREDPCPVYRPDASYRLALEVNRGAFERLGVSVGDLASVRE